MFVAFFDSGRPTDDAASDFKALELTPNNRTEE
jgi:hypothetical protein